MTTIVFVDSTTLLYTLDRANPRKQARSRLWLSRLAASDRMALNVQVLNEVYWVVRRKSAFADLRPAIRGWLADLRPWAVCPLGHETVDLAWGLEERYRLGWWDALLLASAGQGGCAVFLSEDLNDAQFYGEVRVLDPFRNDPEVVLA